MVRKSKEQAVSESLEASPELLPYMPELLQDLWALGSVPELIIKVLKPLKLTEKTCVLDLGCGKGAVSVTLASELGFNVTGVDGCQAFLETATQKAAEFGVSDLCDFVNEDIFEYIKGSDNFDIVIYASLGGILGDFAEIMAALRKTVRLGGFMVIDDGFLKSAKHLKRQGYRHYRTHQQTLSELGTFGDTLVQELSSDQETVNINVEYLAHIKKRAAEIITREPHLRKPLNAYMRRQEIECTVLDEHILGAIWLLQKNK